MRAPTSKWGVLAESCSWYTKYKYAELFTRKWTAIGKVSLSFQIGTAGKIFFSMEKFLFDAALIRYGIEERKNDPSMTVTVKSTVSFHSELKIVFPTRDNRRSGDDRRSGDNRRRWVASGRINWDTKFWGTWFSLPRGVWSGRSGERSDFWDYPVKLIGCFSPWYLGRTSTSLSGIRPQIACPARWGLSRTNPSIIMHNYGFHLYEYIFEWKSYV